MRLPPAPRRSTTLLRLVVVCALCGCAGIPSAAGPLPPPTAGPEAPRSGALQPAASGPPCPAASTDFAAWTHTYRTLAGLSGIDARTLQAAFAGVSGPNPTVIERDTHQPEFVRPIWEYIDSAVSADRVARGRRAMAEARALLDGVEADYGVPRAIVAAIWGLESNFGSFLGSYDIVQSMATLASTGSRRSFACRELFALLQLMQSGHYPTGKPSGSWAGAIGHTQFLPSTQQQFGVDYDGNGSIDLRGSAADALASAANYLSSHGWTAGLPWGFEVILPDGFDFGSARPDLKRPAAAWIAAGARPAVARQLTDAQRQASTWLFVPAGYAGPAFLVFDNFSVILRYNYATSYALGIGLLSDALAGRPGLQATWPRHEQPLNRDERFALQRLLNAGGYGAGAVDGIIGRKTRAALRAFQADQGRPADGFATQSVLRLLETAVSGSR